MTIACVTILLRRDLRGPAHAMMNDLSVHVPGMDRECANVHVHVTMHSRHLGSDRGHAMILRTGKRLGGARRKLKMNSTLTPMIVFAIVGGQLSKDQPSTALTLTVPNQSGQSQNQWLSNLLQRLLLQ